ncbi:hypothetical protein [Streptomyces sp. NPDC003710]
MADCRASKGAFQYGPRPVDRDRTGSKHHLITDATGIPLATARTWALGDRGYDHGNCRRLVWRLGVKPLVARTGTDHGSGLGTQRQVVVRPFAHLHWFRRLGIRWSISDDIHEAFLTLSCALICR